MLESENLSVTSNAFRSGATYNAIAASVRVDGGMVSPCFAVVIPLEEDISGLIDFAVTAGVDFKIP
jgi:hypothetical protein